MNPFLVLLAAVLGFSFSWFLIIVKKVTREVPDEAVTASAVAPGRRGTADYAPEASEVTAGLRFTAIPDNADEPTAPILEAHTEWALAPEAQASDGTLAPSVPSSAGAVAPTWTRTLSPTSPSRWTISPSVPHEGEALSDVVFRAPLGSRFSDDPPLADTGEITGLRLAGGALSPVLPERRVPNEGRPDGYTVKGDRGTLQYILEPDKDYARAKADIWFVDEQHAQAAGYTHFVPARRAHPAE